MYAPHPTMKVGTLNVNGFVDSATKRSIIFNLINKEQLDIIFLQETHLNDNDNIKDIFKQFKEKIYLNSCKVGRKWGVAILFREGFDISVIKTNKDTDGRILSLLCQLNSQIVNIVNLYCPVNPCHRAEFIASTADYFIKTYDQRIVTNRIVCGDFNCVDDVSLDRTGSRNQQLRVTIGSTELNTITKHYSLHDAYRHLYPNETSYTHHNRTHKTLYFPQDWLRTLRTSEHFDGDLDAIFLIDLLGTKKDITDVKTKDIYAVLLDRTQKDASYKTNWENIFTETIKWKKFGKH